MTGQALEVVGLEKRYGPLEALRQVSFHVQEGEMFGLLGPNGAGKTTLTSIVAGLVCPTAGSVRLFGQEVHYEDREARRSLGLVPQELALYGELTAQENLAFFGELYGLDGDRLRRRVQAVLDAIGLADRARHRVSTFSGGMKRRLNLGCALVHEPRLLLLYEPTVGVDPQSRNAIFEEIRRLNSLGTTIVYTSHYLEEVQSLCTRIGILDHGKLVACDTLTGLLALLPAEIVVRVEPASAELLQGLEQLPGVRRMELRNGRAHLECGDLKGVLFQMMKTLDARGGRPVELQIREPSLERVFLHLTGEALRD